ncbi:MAG TPA: YbjN domain-containing protein [Polyangiaceae bacterium]|jgi:hypothetical protein|nr:MAG: hypothetical protein BWY17_00366 [Deltaproteobacteria bacterium ADurb.Bin207]HNS96112.1 YbjN domain-containing protein [Polyangiaceae bacterium]HNZ22147.1 YbjN domain-containing protein [Polyangiaceae bacterium]HOD21357.1 YbjN domain-containing protein [Polyangiaceae bacterium]HOE46971.1 YbjN domain-containing protein [Polyangiaceae bacterium]
MGTTIQEITAIFKEANIHFDVDEDLDLIRSLWSRGESTVTLVVFVLEDGELVQLRAPTLLQVDDDANKPLLFRAMLQMAYEIRLVQFEYDPADGEVSTCIDIALEDGKLTSAQLLRCCAVLLDVAFLAHKRLTTILETGKDPALDSEDVDEEEAEQRQSQLDAMAKLAALIRRGGGGEA